MSVIIVVEIACNCYQDVSDRVEKEPEGSFVVRRLEDGCDTVVKGDWKDHISIELYNGKIISEGKKNNQPGHQDSLIHLITVI